MSTWEYIYLAVGTGVLGVAITFAVVLICQYLGFSMLDHLWLLGRAYPAVALAQRYYCRDLP
jgi:UPF0716 family protein affecting phage T7 exclusion